MLRRSRSGPRRRVVRLMSPTRPKARSRGGSPCSRCRWVITSYLSLAMSTPEGHSDLHALHSTQRSSASAIRSPVASSSGSAPLSTWRNRFARPRVECSSSRVTMNEGHIPPVSFRHAPCPLHCSAARAIPPSTDQSNVVGMTLFTVHGASRRLSSSAGVSTILPGLRRPFGSNARFTSRNASVRRGPNIRSVYTPRRMPSPCSPESEPPNSMTRSATSEVIERMTLRPSSSLMFTDGRMCRQPSEACP